MKNKLKFIIPGLIVLSLGISGCQKGDLFNNPNALQQSSTVPVSLILNHITSNMMKEEEPVISTVYRWNQNIVSNYSYYFGSNSYNWSNTGDMYDNLKYCVKMEEQSYKQFGNKTNIYFALSKFFKAYGFIWLSQRVGDIPMSQALDPNNTTPAYDNQHDVYKNCLALLDTANTLIANLGTAGASSTVAGDIYGRTQLQWQKIINAYRLRVLISLSKRASDNADLNVQAQFATIVNNPSQYPIMASNSDNLIYTYTAVTLYPPNRSGNAPYNNCENINTTFMNLLVPNNDPRIYTLTSPATALIAGGKSLSDSSAYIGINNNQTQASFVTFTGDGLHSCLNYNRYMSSASGANAEPYIIIGYPEMCFNIAEAINRGWVTGTTATWYKNGILAHMGLLGLSDGKSITISNYDGSKTLGTVMVNVTNFINNANIVYAGDNATGLTQILTQKYIAFFMNSGYESYYNWRRTGVPAFNQGGAGIGTPSLTIPYRWQYPQNEISYNSTNYNAALQAQGFTSDDLNAKIWLIK